jgi:hypothetical protein
MTTNFGEQLENCPGLETVVLVRRSMSFPVSICSVSGSVKLSGGECVAAVITKRLKNNLSVTGTCGWAKTVWEGSLKQGVPSAWVQRCFRVGWIFQRRVRANARHLTILGLIDCPISLFVFGENRFSIGVMRSVFLPPFQGSRREGGYPGLRFAPPWATFPRRFAAEQLSACDL